jgi:hypothetical protein
MSSSIPEDSGIKGDDLYILQIMNHFLQVRAHGLCLSISFSLLQITCSLVVTAIIKYKSLRIQNITSAKNIRPPLGGK